MVQYLLGIDVGTTGTKSILFNATGEGGSLASAYRPYALHTPAEGICEQSAHDLWEAVVETVREVLRGFDGSLVAGISLSTQGGTLIPVDENFEPTRPAIVWSDTRCREEKEDFLRIFGDDRRMYEMSGWHLSPGLLAMEIRRMKRLEGEAFAKTKYFLSVADYISAKLTGILAVDISNVGINQLCDIRAHKYDREILDFCGIGEDKLPRIMNSARAIGPLTPEAASLLGLSERTILSSGAHDQYAVALGAGATKAGDVIIGSGTSWVVTAICGEPDFEGGLCVSESAIEGCWGELLSLSSGGVCLEWLRKSVASSGELLSYRELDAGAEGCTAATRGLYFFPFDSKFGEGRRGGTMGSTSGAFVGLSLADDKFSMARAVMEGVAFQTAWMLEAFGDSGDTIILAGGASKSALWAGILADVTGLVILIPEEANLACVGAAIMAGIGCGIYPDAEAGTAALCVGYKRIEPSANASAMRAAFCEYKRVAEGLGEIYSSRK